MRYPWIDEYLMQKPGVTKDLQAEWNWIRYMIGGKMFAAILLDPENKPYYINLKLEPAQGECMRGMYPDVIPGYYSNKLHWNSVLADGDVPDGVLRDMLDTSRRLVLRGFSKQKQRELLGITCCGMVCAGCPFYAKRCAGCNAARGRVFHAPEGKPCPIYACCAGKRYASCAECGQLPCDVWRATRDPSMAEEQFRKDIDDRVSLLRASF